MTDHTSKPTPYSQFCFFKSLSLSLYEYDWYNFVESWQAMVAVNAPIPEFSYNLVPFFGNARRLLPVFNRYMVVATHDQDFLNTMTTVVMSTPLLIKVQDILRSQHLFLNYVHALKLDNQSASHTEVMRSVQEFLNQVPPATRLLIQKAFAEAEASDSMGLSSTTLETALGLLQGDIQLYIDFLTTLQLNQTRNMAWNIVVSKIKTLVTARKPYCWNAVDGFLQQLHWGHFQQQYHYSGATAVLGYDNGGGHDYALGQQQQQQHSGHNQYHDQQQQQQRQQRSDLADEEEDEGLVIEKVEGIDYLVDELDDLELGTGPTATTNSNSSIPSAHHSKPSLAEQTLQNSPSTLKVADFSKMSIS